MVVDGEEEYEVEAILRQNVVVAPYRCTMKCILNIGSPKPP